MSRPIKSDGSRGHRLRRLLAAALTLCLAGAMAIMPANASERYPRPTGATLTLTGHGFGHGIGMSQWGAYGAAAKGLAWPAIIDFYYPGTQLATAFNQVLRVRLDVLGQGGAAFVSQPGLSLQQDASAPTTLPTQSEGQTIDQWRVRRDGGALRLQYRTSGGWTTDNRPVGTAAAFVNPDSGVVRVVRSSKTLRDYRGTMSVQIRAAGGTQTVNSVPMESYLRSVVPSEMPASWATEALRAQAVAARTYAAFERAAKSPTSGYDTCDTTWCQVYAGQADYTLTGALVKRHEYAASDSAVSATKGKLVTYRGRAAFTQFSASNGGWGVKGSQPYLVAQKDPYDGAIPSSAHSWTKDVSLASIEKAFPTIGELTRIDINARDGNGDLGGRVTSMQLVGTSGIQELSGASFRTTFGLRSDWFTPTGPRWHTAVVRVSGPDRIGTAIATSKELFPISHQAGAVVLAADSAFPDGLSGVPLAASKQAPLLLSNSSVLDGRTLTEIQRVLIPKGTVYLLGGAQALSHNVTTALSAESLRVVRLGGADRYETAALIADELPEAKVVILASGLDFADALSAGPAAAAVNGAVLLTQAGALPPATRAALASRPGAVPWAVGGPAAAAAGSLVAKTHRLIGADRYETSTLTARAFTSGATTVTFASGEAFPDALSGGAFAAAKHAPVLLITHNQVPSALVSYLNTIKDHVAGAALFGGAAAISEPVRTSLESRLN